MTRTKLIAALAKAGAEDPSSEAFILLDGLFGVSTASALADKAREYDDATLYDAIERRRNNEPVQYIVGKAYFCNEVYFLNESCLIPRADTEQLVLHAWQLAPKNGRFADLFCGSGCVGISLAAMRDDLSGVGVDISAGALEMAKKNAAENGVADRISFICGDVAKAPLGDVKFDIITANPPYITAEEMLSLAPEVLREPHLALYGGEDGLDLFRAMLASCAHNLADGGYILCEIGWRQGDGAIKTAAEYGFDCEIIPDLNGIPRIAKMKRRI
ncbi:MAG: peptide chain release factor N(5)-glutamine methyltransferase [Clostridia bacterium]|nr:peptide chain release factor N(5)-glutamine methyltransferase [Clostridia bacterium]